MPPTPLLLSKLQPPVLPRGSVQRSRLIDRLLTSEAKTQLIIAPGGNGKTTLMAQAYHELRRREQAAAWLTLDQSDNCASDLIEYLSHALLDEAEGTAWSILGGGSPPAALAALLNAVVARSRKATVFFDDLHLLTCPTCLSLIKTLIADPAGNLRFVISSRSRPAIEVARLQMQGTLQIIGAARLNFTLAEAAVLLGRDPADDRVRDLHCRTHGWPVALKLFSQTAVMPAADPQALRAHRAEAPDLNTYLTEQLMTHLPAPLAEFLTVTSLPARITAALANQLCERADSHSTLQQLEREGLFITADEDRPGWYQYHEFFREFLRERLAQHSGLDLRLLHRRAAEWFLAARQFEDALRHSLEGGAWQLAIAILEKEGGWRIALKYGGEVLHGIEAIPEEAIQPSLVARLTLVYLLLHFGQPDRARETFEELRTQSADFTEWRGRPLPSRVRTECHAMEAIIILDEEQPLPVSLVERIEQEACALGARGEFVRIVTHSGLAIYANYDAGNYRECIRLAEEGFTALKDIDAHFGLGYLHIYLGMSQFALGRLHLAQTSYRNALELAATQFPHESQKIEAHACMAESQYYADDLQSARSNIDVALAGLKDQSAVDGPVFQVTYLTAAALYARAHDLDSALSLLMDARAVAQYLQRWQRLANIDIRRVEELTRAGYLDDAQEITQREGFRHALANNPSCIPLLAMQASLALARLELATRNTAAASRRLLALQARCEQHQHELLKLKCLTLLVACQFALGDHEGTMRGARKLCSRVIPLGLRRVVADEESLIRPALEYAFDAEDRSGSAARANFQVVLHDWLRHRDDRPLRSSSGQTSACAVVAEVPPEVLSPRQREVLELLAAGFSGKEIATRLRLSESTVKSYRKSLYARLRAGRRSQALANARRLSLLP